MLDGFSGLLWGRENCPVCPVNVERLATLLSHQVFSLALSGYAIGGRHTALLKCQPPLPRQISFLTLACADAHHRLSLVACSTSLTRNMW